MTLRIGIIARGVDNLPPILVLLGCFVLDQHMLDASLINRHYVMELCFVMFIIMLCSSCTAHYVFVYVGTLLFSFVLYDCFYFFGLISVLVYCHAFKSCKHLYVYASFAKFTCSRFCFVLLCIWCLQINWIGLDDFRKKLKPDVVSLNNCTTSRKSVVWQIYRDPRASTDADSSVICQCRLRNEPQCRPAVDCRSPSLITSLNTDSTLRANSKAVFWNLLDKQVIAVSVVEKYSRL